MKPKIVGLVILIAVFLICMDAFAAQFNFTPRVSAKETYTDNVNLTSSDKEDDYITEATAGGTFSILGKTSGMNLSFDPGYAWYKNNTRDDTWRLPATLDLYSDISRRTRFEIFDRFIRSEDPDSDEPVISEETGEVRAPGDTSVRRGRDWFYTNYATARVDHQFGSDDSVYGQFAYSLRREESSDGNDNNRYAPSAGLTYWFGPKWGTSVEAGYTRALFKNSDDYHNLRSLFQLQRRFSRRFQLYGRLVYLYRDNDGGNAEDYQLYAPSAGFSYFLARDSRISLGLGYYYQDFDEGDNEQSFFGNADFYKRWNYQRWSASLLGQTGLDQNDYGTERLGFEWFAGIIGQLRYDFARTFFGNVSGRSRYSDIINESREEIRYRIGAGLGWLPTRWMTLSLDYYFNGLDSADTSNYQENRVWFRITLRPDRPWRFKN